MARQQESEAWTLGTASFNRSAGARATFTFTGTSVTWIGFRAPWAGIARVFVDGTFVTELDLYQTSEQPQAPVFTASNLAAGSHTLTVESTGLKNASSSDYPVVVDAFDVSPSSPPPPTGTRFEETATATSFTAGWTQGDTTRAWSGATAAVSVTSGARAVFTFTGTSVRWIGLSGPQTGIARVYLDGAFQGPGRYVCPDRDPGGGVRGHRPGRGRSPVGGRSDGPEERGCDEQRDRRRRLRHAAAL